MRWNVRDFCSICNVSLPIRGPIFEFGALEPLGQTEGFGDLRALFPDREYVGCDLYSGNNVDKVLDLENIELESNTVPTVLVLDTLEHVTNPFKATEESYRVLDDKGLVILSVPFNFPIHCVPDYWRFTPYAILELLKNFPTKLVLSESDVDDATIPHTVFGIGSKDSSLDFTALMNNYSYLLQMRELDGRKMFSYILKD